MKPMCGEREPGQTSGHQCIGDQGHPDLHWCLLGHVWPNEQPNEETPESRRTA